MNKEWKGYTLEQIETRRAINKLRIDFERQKLLSNIGVGDAPSAEISTFSRVVNLTRASISLIMTAKKIISIARSFKK